MKRLIALISTAGKTPERIKTEAVAAYEKFQKVKADVTRYNSRHDTSGRQADKI